MGLLLMIIACIFAVIVFRLATEIGWHWGFAAFLAAVPLGATYFMSIFGFIGAALFVGAMYRAAASAP